MAVNIFDEDAEKLPHVAAAGDIIQLHRVTVFPDSILRVLRYFRGFLDYIHIWIILILKCLHLVLYTIKLEKL